MSLWAYQNQFTPIDGRLSRPREPGTDSQRIDRIVQILAKTPFEPNAGAVSTGPRGRPMPTIAGFSGREASASPWETDREGDLPGLRLSPDGRSVQLAWVGAAPIALRMGQAGLTGLRALGAGAAATLSAILQSFHDRLGRLPTPQELGSVLSEKIPEAAALPGASSGAAGKRLSEEEESECEMMRAEEEDRCNRYMRMRNPEAGKICHNSARQRYSECLHRGIFWVATPLADWE